MAQVLQGPSRVLEWPDRHGLTPVILIRPLKSARSLADHNVQQLGEMNMPHYNSCEEIGKNYFENHLRPHEAFTATSIMMPPIRQMFIHVH